METFLGMNVDVITALKVEYFRRGGSEPITEESVEKVFGIREMLVMPPNSITELKEVIAIIRKEIEGRCKQENTIAQVINTFVGRIKE